MGRVYTVAQIICAFPPTCLKVWEWILSWQGKSEIKVHVESYAKALKLTVEEVEQAIQTLINYRFIRVSLNEDYMWVAEINAKKVHEIMNVNLSKVINSPCGLELSRNVTWNKDDALDQMSEVELEERIQRLQSKLNEIRSTT